MSLLPTTAGAVNVYFLMQIFHILFQVKHLQQQKSHVHRLQDVLQLAPINFLGANYLCEQIAHTCEQVQMFCKSPPVLEFNAYKFTILLARVHNIFIYYYELLLLGSSLCL